MNLTQFQQTVSSTDKPIVLDFWANWCVPCRVTKPILEKLAEEYKGKIEFLPIDADQSREVLDQFKIIDIPTVMALREGRVAARVTGAQNEAGYRAMFEALAGGGEVKVPMSAFDRVLRLGAGALLAMIGISTGNWLVLGVGGIVAFLGMYDRCPIWRAVTGLISSKILRKAS
jgi:thioredoxin 1